MAVSAATVLNWEKGATEPPSAFWPAITAFLGYNPAPPPQTLTERMRAYRYRHGLSIKEAALRAEVHEDSWGRWERTGVVSWERYRRALDEFLSTKRTANSD